MLHFSYSGINGIDLIKSNSAFIISIGLKGPKLSKKAFTADANDEKPVAIAPNSPYNSVIISELKSYSSKLLFVNSTSIICDTVNVSFNIFVSISKLIFIGLLAATLNLIFAPLSISSVFV